MRSILSSSGNINTADITVLEKHYNAIFHHENDFTNNNCHPKCNNSRAADQLGIGYLLDTGPALKGRSGASCDAGRALPGLCHVKRNYKRVK